MLRLLWPVLVLACVWLQATPASALDPARRMTQYAHTAWRMQDGVFSATPSSIVQTPDGYIWIGTADGVMQFDGTRFVRWTPGPGQRLRASEVLHLATTADGSVWVSAFGVLSRWKDGRLTDYASGSSGNYVVAGDRAATIWIGRSFVHDGGGPLCEVLDNDLRCLGAGDGVPSVNAIALLAARDGSLWLGGDTLIARRTGGAWKTYPLPGLASNRGIMGVPALSESPDGTVWAGVAKAGPGLGLLRFVDGRWQPFDTPALRGSSLAVTSLSTDREGSLWVGTYDRGLYRIHDGVVDHFDQTHGLSSNYVSDLTEDREGNLWVVTAQGVDRFADTAVVSVTATEGLCVGEASTVLAARDGSIWAGGDGALTHLHDGGVTCLRTGHGLPGSQVTSLFEDHAGRLWVGLDQGLWVYANGRFHEITRADHRPIGLVTGIAEDVNHRLWITAAGPPRILMRVEGLKVREDVAQPPMPRRVEADPAGGLWLGLVNGDLAHIRDGQAVVHVFDHPDGAAVHQLLADTDGSVIAATSYGLVGWRDGKTLTLTAKNGLPCEQVYAMAFDRRGDLWLYMNCALGVLTSADLQAWKKMPGRAVTMRTFDAIDGVRPSAASFVAGARAPDGRLWFANGQSLQVVAPERLGGNAVPPPVHIEQVVADRLAYPTRGALRLPALTRDLQIDYVALSFVAPQKVQFRYRLDGRDEAWQEPGTRRQAFYTDLRPGAYRFRVIARNNDGVWNAQGASLEIVIAAAWYQTPAFLMLMVLAGSLAAWAAIRFRMRQMARALNVRLDERLEERTRMARDLHDTLLQTLQGSKMVADTALTRPEDTPALVRALRQVSAWLGQARDEARSAVDALRSSATESNDLAEAFERAVEDCRRRGTLDASLTVTGEAREMHPVARDELYRIGYEAIRNACRHSHGHRLDVGLNYGRDLTLRVADDGVGMELAVAERGKEGHFGLRGMRERAGRIGAKLSVTSGPRAGTVIVVTVPGRVTFRRASTGLLSRIRSVISGTDETTTRP